MCMYLYFSKLKPNSVELFQLHLTISFLMSSLNTVHRFFWRVLDLCFWFGDKNTLSCSLMSPWVLNGKKKTWCSSWESGDEENNLNQNNCLTLSLGSHILANFISCIWFSPQKFSVYFGIEGKLQYKLPWFMGGKKICEMGNITKLWSRKIIYICHIYIYIHTQNYIYICICLSLSPFIWWPIMEYWL